MGALEQELAELHKQLGLHGGQTPPPSQSLDIATMQLIVDYASDCISVHEPDGHYLFVSQGFVTYFGWQPQDLVGHSAYEFFHPNDVARIAADHANYGWDNRSIHSVTYRLRCTDGNYRWVETRSEAYVTEQGIQRIIGFTRDLTELFRSIEALRNRVTELDLLSGHDDLTGLANRRALRERLGYLLKEARRNRPLALALVDIYHFKQINDKFGHMAGDSVMVGVANALSSSCRDSDLVARYGGDEFCILFVDATLEQACVLAERQRQAVARLNLSEIFPTICIGVTVYENGDTIDTMLSRADAALYEAKARGRNQVRVTALDKMV